MRDLSSTARFHDRLDNDTTALARNATSSQRDRRGIQNLGSRGCRYFLFMHHPRFLKHINLYELAPEGAAKKHSQHLHNPSCLTAHSSRPLYGVLLLPDLCVAEEVIKRKQHTEDESWLTVKEPCPEHIMIHEPCECPARQMRMNAFKLPF